MTRSAADRLKEIVEGKKGEIKAPQGENAAQHGQSGIDSLKKGKVSEKKGKGGARPGAGRKPKMSTLIERGIQQWVDQHVNEEVDVVVTDRKTGQTITIKKPRVAYVLEKLYQIGVGSTTKGSADALSKWLDRALGKAPQPIRGDAADDTPIRLEHDIGDILDKAYGDD